MIHMGVDCQQKCGKVKFKLKQHNRKKFPLFCVTEIILRVCKIHLENIFEYF